MSMIVPGSVSPMMAAAGDNSCESYQISRSVRFNSAQSKYLARTPASSGNRKTLTWSGWLKRSAMDSEQDFWNSSNATGNVRGYFRFNSANQLLLSLNNPTLSFNSTSVYRDTSAHMHVHLQVDTTQAIASDRLKIWVNGVQVTAGTFNYPALNADTEYNIGGQVHAISGSQPYVAEYFDGYISEVYFIDGQSLDASYFGFICPTTGQWRPKKYAGTYGTNGFYLDFSDNSAATAAALGADRSGNGNNWTLTNISVAAGAANDSLTDTTSNNFCTWDNIYPGDSVNTNGGLDAPGTARGTFDAGAMASYWEITANAVGVVGGVVSAAGTANTVSVPNGSTYGFRYAGGLLEYTTDGATWTTIASGLTGQQFPYATGAVNSANFGQRPFGWALPPGYVTLCSKNLSGGDTVAVSGAFTGNASADGPFVFMLGAPETLTINGNAVTFGTHADRLANGFKVRTTSASYNIAGSNAWAATVKSPQNKSLFKYQNAGGN